MCMYPSSVSNDMAFILIVLLAKHLLRGSPKRIKKSHVPGGLSINWKVKVKQAGGAGPGA